MLGDVANGSCPVMLVSEARPRPPQIPFSDEYQVTVMALARRKANPESKTPEHQVRTSLSPTGAGDCPPLCSLRGTTPSWPPHFSVLVRVLHHALVSPGLLQKNSLPGALGFL